MSTQPTPTSEADDKKFPCPYCQRAFSSAEDLNKHVLTRHTQTNLGKLPQTAPAAKKG